MPGIQVFRLSSQSNATDALPEIVAEFHPYKAFLVFNELEKLAFDPSSSAGSTIARPLLLCMMAQFTLTCVSPHETDCIQTFFFFEKM